MTIKHYKTTEI